MWTRRLGALALALSLAGCIGGTCGQEIVQGVTATDLETIHELGELGDPRVPSNTSIVDPRPDEAFTAIAPLLSSTDVNVRIAALEAIRHLAERARDLYRNRFRGLFDRMLVDPEPEVRWRAAWALGRMDTFSPALRDAIADPVARVAERAAWAVGELRDEEAAPALVAALDREPPISARAIASLRRITGRDLSTAEEWRAWAAGPVEPPPEEPLPEDTLPEGTLPEQPPQEDDPPGGGGGD